jgi:hypothetical protein
MCSFTEQRTHFCSFENCDYNTTRLYNLKRHIVSKHNNNIPINNSINLQNHSINSQNNSISSQNNSITSQNNSITSQNNSMDSENNNIPSFQCEHCYKNLTTRFNMLRHQKTCKKVKNPHECMYCHATFGTQQSKSRHEKKCKDTPKTTGAEITPTNQTNIDIANIQNATITTNTTNNITNNNTNNINLVVFPLAENKLVQFRTDHITMEKLLQAIHSASTPPDGLAKFTNILLENPANHIIQKPNKRDPDCKVHTGKNQWTIVQDKKIFPKLTDSISSEVAHKIEFDLPDSRLSKHRKKPHLDYYNDIVSTITPTPQYREAKKIVEYAIKNHLEKQKHKPSDTSTQNHDAQTKAENLVLPSSEAAPANIPAAKE